jgi:phage shock protein A
MKRLVLVLIAGVVMVPLLLALTPGCGPRFQVAKKKALDRLDDALGKMDVEKAQIDQGIKGAKQGLEGVRRARIKAQVQVAQLDEKAKPSQERIEQCDRTLVRLRDLIKADKPAEIGGKTYSQNDLNEMADQVIHERKVAESQVNSCKAARQRLEKVVVSLTKAQQTVETRLTTLQGQVAQLEAEMAGAKAMQQAAGAMGDGDATLMANLDNLEAKIAGLTADARATLQGEEEKIQVAGANKTIDNVNTFMRNLEKPKNRVEQINQILTAKK